jgi:hypothetical protein
MFIRQPIVDIDGGGQWVNDPSHHPLPFFAFSSEHYHIDCSSPLPYDRMPLYPATTFFDRAALRMVPKNQISELRLRCSVCQRGFSVFPLG